MFSFINNNFCDEQNASIHIQDLTIQRGYGVFDFFRTVNQTPLFLNEHINRLYESAQELHLLIPYSKTELKEIICKLIQKNNMGNSGIRITITGGYSADTYNIAKPNVIIAQQALSTPVNTIQSGIKIITHNYVRDLPNVKSINYLMGVYLQKKIKEQNASDVLYVNSGWVTELPRANFFIVKNNNTIVTSASNVLHGITRMKLIDWASKDFNIEIRDINEEELYNCSEAFITSTTKRILPVIKINETLINYGEIGKTTQLLHKLFLENETEIVLSSQM
jgi:branched-chain amino acid aminotransferase